MSKKILAIVDAVANEKSITKENIFDALEAAIIVATKKKYPKESIIKVKIDRKFGTFETFRKWLIVEKVNNSNKEISINLAKSNDPDSTIGNYIKKKIPSISFDRISTQSAKQVIVKKVKEAKYKNLIEKFKKKEGKIIKGIVKKIYRNKISLDLGSNVEGCLYKEEMIPKEEFYLGKEVKGIPYYVKYNTYGLKVLISRIRNEMLSALFYKKVPEVRNGIIKIKASARNPGLRSKIAVKTYDLKIDPVGACVGIRGIRIQSISNELNGERVDVIPWSDDIVQFVKNAMSPAKINKIKIKKNRNIIDILVSSKNLAQAIGKNGQNIRLASKLTGWSLNVMTENNINIKKL
ncbi:MAG: transcription termination factor NusA [Enterobacteriaceae bacterium]